MNDLILISLLIIFLILVDVFAWMQACFVTSYIKTDHDWRKIFVLYTKVPMRLYRYFILIIIITIFISNIYLQESSGVVAIFLILVSSIMYVCVAAWSFYGFIKGLVDDSSE